jgi:hypothetical protein
MNEIELNHGVPDHNYFVVAQPDGVVPVTFQRDDDPNYKREVILLKDPKTAIVTKTEVHGVFRWTLDDFRTMNGFSFMAYGLNAEKLANVLKRRYPKIERTNIVCFILLKKL